ncbi:MAG: spore germination protein [Clostridia bacterium]|nr:spore germination protein [Clostridia bacterium]
MAKNPADRVFSGDFEANARIMDAELGVLKSFDMTTRTLDAGGIRLRIYFINGFIKDVICERVLSALMTADGEKIKACESLEKFIDRFIPYDDVRATKNIAEAVEGVLSGRLLLLIEGFDGAAVLDAREYPAREVAEPDNDRVLRGSRDGFVETLVYNAALIRRRIRSGRLVMEKLQIGNDSKTDVAVCYMDGEADGELLYEIKAKLRSIKRDALTFGQESLTESLVKRQWFNPFPRVRYTERPDVAVSGILEGKIIVLVDNSPAAMILPTFFLDFLQETNDYYFPPLVGTYLRCVRIIVYFVTLFMTPVWYCLVKNDWQVPEYLVFIKIEHEIHLPIIVQLLIIELLVECMRIASLNTPNALSNSFSVIGTLILGEFGVESGWFVPEVIFFMAFVAIANFTQPSFELGYAFKLFRIFMIILIAAFDYFGLLAGIVIMAAAALNTRTVTGHPYMYPIIPFDGRALKDLFVRESIKRGNN